MNYRNATPDKIRAGIKKCLDRLYEDDEFLFRRNNGRGVCERSLVFRFAHYLQKEISDFFVDCDFNSSFEDYVDPQANIRRRERGGKPITNADGTVTKRFVDIIVHRRDHNTQNDFICFEVKKWNNNSASEQDKDRNNLRILTSKYGYCFGFHLTLGRRRNNTKWTIFRNGETITEDERVFANGTSA
jgi:hypothetical protein